MQDAFKSLSYSTLRCHFVLVCLTGSSLPETKMGRLLKDMGTKDWERVFLTVKGT